MKDTQQRQWMQSLRSAAALGTPDALALAVQGLLEDKTIAANRPLPLGRVEKELLPAGEILAKPSVPRVFLEELGRLPYAAFRALAAAAWTLRYLRGDPRAKKPLEALAKDERDEVRHAVMATLRTHGPQHAPRFRELVQEWLTRQPPPSPRVQAIALELLPRVAEGEDVTAVLDWLEKAPLQSHPVVQRAWVKAVAALGARDGPTVLHRFGRWLLTRPRRAPWIAQALSRPWAARHPQQTLNLLQAMYHRWGRRRWITQALQALERAEVLPIPPEQLLQQWTETDLPPETPS